MKKKICGILAIVFIMFSCLFVSACGNKYKKLEFEISYAFSEDASEWFDATNGLSLTYSEFEGEYVFKVGDQEFLLDKNDCNIYLKVNVKNVKKKHIDLITVSAENSELYGFDSKNVEQGQVFDFPVKTIVDTKLTVYENASSKNKTIDFSIYKNLTNIERNANLNPAVYMGDSLNLKEVSNLIVYEPNQSLVKNTSVSYELKGIGYFDSENNFVSSASGGAILFEDGVLSVDEHYALNTRNNVVEILVKSDYDEEISTSVYVNIVNKVLNKPEVTFKSNSTSIINASNVSLSGVDLYIGNTTNYKTTLVVKNNNSSIYSDGVYTGNGLAKLKTVLYINGLTYESYADKFSDIAVENQGDEYTFILDEGFEQTSLNVKFAFEYEGLNCLNDSLNAYTDFVLRNHSLAEFITLNNVNFENNSNYSDYVYDPVGTYKGYQVKVGISPVDNFPHLFGEQTVVVDTLVQADRAKVKIIDSNGEIIDLGSDEATLPLGETIYIQINPGYTNAKLIFKTLNTPVYYDGEVGTSGNYISTTLELEKQITASKIEIVDASDSDDYYNAGGGYVNLSEVIVGANIDRFAYLRVEHKGSLSEETVNLSLDENSDMVFGNSLKTISLAYQLDESVVAVASGTTAGGLNYSVYKIKIKATGVETSSSLSVLAGSADVGVTCYAVLRSKFIIDDDETLKVKAEQSLYVKDFADKKTFAVEKGEEVKFSIVGETNETTVKSIKEITFASVIGTYLENVIPEEDRGKFTSLRRPTVISNNQFLVQTSGELTHIFNILVTCYVDDGFGSVALETKTLEYVQFAVYKPIESISASYELSNGKNKDTIAYVNSEFKEITNTVISYNATWSDKSAPTDRVCFFDGSAAYYENTDCADLKLYLNKNRPSNVEILKYNESLKDFELISGLNDTDDSITINLKNKVQVRLASDFNEGESLSDISLLFKATDEGVATATKTMKINFAKVNRSTGIDVSGDEIIEYSDTVREVQLSFLGVTSDIVKTFTAHASYSSEIAQSGLRFEDLAFKLYKYLYNEHGEKVYQSGRPILQETSDIQVNVTNEEENNVKIIASYSNFNNVGGEYSLIISAKDSYDDLEKVYKNSWPVTIRIGTGEKYAPYLIQTKDDYSKINNELNKHYVLTDDVDLGDITPSYIIGNKNNTAEEFTGSLSGKLATNNADGTANNFTYTIYANFKVPENCATSIGLIGGANIYYSLIAINNGDVKDLKFVLDYDIDEHNYSLIASKNVHIGVCGINNKLVSNVSVEISGDIIFFRGDNINLGSVAGVNSGEITNAKIINNKELKVKIESDKNANIGLVAGSSAGRIVGLYEGKDSLNSINYDIITNLVVENNGTGLVNVGAVVGDASATGTIGNYIAGGQINVEGFATVGGVVGSTEAEVNTVAVFGLNLTSTNGFVGGVAGYSKAKILNARYISASIKIDGVSYFGQIKSGDGVVAGIVANGEAELENCAVESFIETISVGGGSLENFYTLEAKTAYGLANTNKTVKKSFVRANIESTTGGYITTNGVYSLTYFIGKTNITSNYDSTYHVIVNDDNTGVSSNISAFTDINNWATKLEAQFAGISANTSDTNKFALNENYNKITLVGAAYQDKNLYLPYILYNEGGNIKPLMILAPTDIKAEINQSYSIDANLKNIYIDEYNNDTYNIKETIIIDYLSDRYGNEAINTHYLTNATNTGLLDLTIEPNNDENISSGLIYEIVGNGSFYARIDGTKIIFTGVSGNTPIIVRCYSPFNEQDTATYVAFYTQYTFSELLLSSQTNVVEKESLDSFKVDIYENRPAKVDIGAVNMDSFGNVYSTIFERLSPDCFDITVTGYSNLNVSDNETSITISTKDLFNNGDWEELIFNVKLKQGVFEFNGKQYVTANQELGELTLKVYMYHTASELFVTGGDGYDFETHTALNLNVQLKTGYVGDLFTPGTEKTEIFETYVEDGVSYYKDGIIQFNLGGENRDSIKLEIVDNKNNETLRNLVELNGCKSIVDLFDFEIITTLLQEKGTTVGFNYDVSIKFKEGFNYRYIEENIELVLKVYAGSDNSKFTATIITVKPTTVSTQRIANYNVTRIDVKTDAVDELTMGGTESNIITPGGRGNIMMLNLTPSYSKIDEAYLITDFISVPSLGGKEVGLRFTQLVYNEDSKTFETAYHLFTETQVGDRLKLDPTTSYRIDDGEIIKSYDGRIYVYAQLERFSGYETGITATLEVKSNGKTSSVEKTLITTYLPGASLYYQGRSASALIQEETYGNLADLVLYGYQFNSNPTINIAWEIPDGVDYFYTSTEPVDPTNVKDLFNEGACLYYSYDDGDENKYYKLTSEHFDSDGNLVVTKADGTDITLSIQLFKITNKENITISGESKNIYDFVSARLINDYKDVVKNADGSYTMQIEFNIAKDIPTAFSLSAGLTLRTPDGTIVTDISSPFVFEPTKYIIRDMGIKNTSTNRLLLSINRSKKLEFIFETDKEDADFSEDIYAKMVADLGIEGIKECFTYAGGLNFAEVQPEFEISVSGNTLIVYGLKAFSNLITFEVNYSYIEVNGKKEIKFSRPTTGATALSYSFTMQIYSGSSEEQAIAISSAEEFKDMVAGGHYVLMNDITLNNYTPIHFEGSSIGSFDGNNKVITIESFAYDTAITNYGLFGSIGVYQEPGGENIKSILKNVIVDYGSFEGQLNEDGNLDNTGILNLSKFDLANVTFGGLVAENNGGLIYNCDVMNLSYANKTVGIVVKEGTKVVFGGLVGKNTGNITNSRVGRTSYLKINAEQDTTITKLASPLTFQIGNSTISNFEIIAGGFVGNNTGIIASSYMANTSLINYSSSETTNKTAGFVAENASNARISYSYVKALDNNNASDAYSTGCVIEGKSNSIIAGFVFENKGNIQDCFVNTELKTHSAYMAGFVYNHAAGLIENSYAACTMNSGTENNVRDNAEQPFVGKDTKNQYLADGEFKNTYYLLKDTEVGNLESALTQTMPIGISLSNFQEGGNLVGFVFINSSQESEREQGIWSYIDINGNLKLLPELTSANIVAHSARYLVSKNDEGIGRYRDANSYVIGTRNNPDIIRSVAEFNDVYVGDKTDLSEKTSKSGYVRVIDNIDFSSDNTAIKTRVNFTLGNDKFAYDVTSLDGNGMSISGVYLDVASPIGDKIGLFAQISNAYVKNLNIKFSKSASHGSTSSVKYHGGLAGYIEDSIIINVNLEGDNVLFTGQNFVGGLAGAIKGESLIYGITSNISVRATSTNDGIYVPLADYIENGNSEGTYELTMLNMSYAGGLAGVIDLTKRGNNTFNVSYVEIKGNKMSQMTENQKVIANISAEYAGGLAGYAGAFTETFKSKYTVGTSEYIEGGEVAGGIYAISLGGLTACQVTANEETQYDYDTEIGKYVIDLESGNSTIDSGKCGNLSLIRSGNIAGGLIGVGLLGGIDACYTKASISNGKIIGGMIGMSFATSVTYSYAIPYIAYNESLELVGGMIGSAHIVNVNSLEAGNSEYRTYESIARKYGEKYYTGKLLKSDLQYTLSTVILNQNDFIENGARKDSATINYISATGNVTSAGNTTSKSAFYGIVNYDNDLFENLNENYATYSSVKLSAIYDTKNNASIQKEEFDKVFSDWAVIPYWSLDESMYFPLLLNYGVRNWILIEKSADFLKLTANPTGNYLVVEDINMADGGYVTGNSNWVFPVEFSGILMGQIESETGERKRVFNLSLKPGSAGETAGLFQSTKSATISNLIFEWAGSAAGAIQPTVTNLDFVAGLSCEDTYESIEVGGVTEILGSSFTNVDVLVTGNDNNYLLNTTSTISGFAGLVYKTTNSGINNCTFAGQINVDIKQISATESYFAGLVGVASCAGVNASMNIMNCKVISGLTQTKSGQQNLKTVINITTANSQEALYLSGGIGKSSGGVAVSAISVGEINNNQSIYNPVVININATEIAALNAGGLIAFANTTRVLESNAVTEMTILDATTGINESFVGGLIGSYQIYDSKYILNSSNSSAKIVYEAITTNLSIAGGIGNLHSSNGTQFDDTLHNVDKTFDISNCLFTGSIVSEPTILNTQNVDAGGVVGSASSTYLSISETMSTTDITAHGTISADMGGIVGSTSASTTKLLIENCVSSGKIVPVADTTTNNVYVGGFIGNANNTEINISNSYSVSAIISDGVQGGVRSDSSKLDTVVGNYDDTKTHEFTNIMVSSDISMAENKLDIPNISAVVMYLDGNNNVHSGCETGGFVGNNTLWTKFKTNGENRLPYLTSLYSQMLTYGVTKKSAAIVDYVSGSSLNPIKINTESYQFDAARDGVFTYYVVTTSVLNSDGLKKLNGVIIGNDAEVELKQLSKATDNDWYGAIAEVTKHSAISNLHLNATCELSSLQDIAYSGYITANNQGYIFNCSVQGTNLKATGSGVPYFGVIAGQNAGVVAYSYSSAEIMECISASGVVYMNVGTIDTCYFTGYINNTTSSAGIVVNNEAGYVFNSYMAGVVETLLTEEDSNSLGNNVNEIVRAKNNFIDKFANVEVINTAKNDITDVLRYVSTAELMANCGLSGNWYTTVSGGTINKASSTFGLNYGYPIYTFNKTADPYGTNDTIEIDISYSLHTGTGEKNNNYTQAQRYNALVNPTDPTQIAEFNNAYKIPHYGVLGAVENLIGVYDETKAQNIGSDLNYIIIYDLGNIKEDLTATDCLEWKAVGLGSDSTTGFNGWKTIDVSSAIGFNGVIVSHKGLSISSEAVATPADAGEEPGVDVDTICTISGLKGNGLFANINNAIIGTMQIHSFCDLNNSGALGTNVISTTIVDNIIFNDNSVITGTTSGYVGGLFGLISIPNSEPAGATASAAVDEYLQITNISISEEGVVLAGNVAGLIAGRVTNGKIYLDSSEYKVQFDYNRCAISAAGGLFGEISSEEGIGGAVIEANVNILHTDAGASSGATEKVFDISLIAANLSANGETGELGGFVGKISKDATLTVSDIVKMTFAEAGATEQIFKSFNFGGFVANNLGSIIVNELELNENFKVNSKGYFGLVVGKLGNVSSGPSGEKIIDLSSVTIGSLRILGTTFEITGDPDTANDNQGAGLLSGYHCGDLTINGDVLSLATAGTKLKVDNRNNLGVISGVYYNGHINLVKIEKTIILDGKENVGSIFGLVKGKLVGTQKNESGAGATIAAASEDYKFAHDDEFLTQQPELDPDYYMELIGWENNGAVKFGKDNRVEIILNNGSKNVGGLFGKSEADLINIQSASSEESKPTCEVTFIYDVLKNDDNVTNIGGIVGYVLNAKLVNCENNVAINSLIESAAGGSSVGIYSTPSSKIIKITNVGGIVGLLQKTPEVAVASNITTMDEPVEPETLTLLEDDVYAFDCVNNAIIQLDAINKDEKSIKDFDHNKSVNVGGIFGQINAQEDIKISNCFVANEEVVIAGYQNVGAVVGFINVNESSDVTLTGEHLIKEDSEGGASSMSDATSNLIGNDGKLIEEFTTELNVGTVAGVLNIGGIAGYINKNATISNMNASVFIKGNANIGGVVGQIGTNVILENNFVGSKDINAEKAMKILGVYYHYQYEETIDGEKQESIASFIPTSIGGIVGVSSTSEAYVNNVVHNVAISTVQETETIIPKGVLEEVSTGTISTLYNYMFTIKSDLDGGDADFTYFVPLTDTTPKVQFNKSDDNRTTGIGGFAGTIDASIIVNNTNAIKNITIYTPLGINVGSLYGSYNVEYISTSLPRVYHTSGNEITIDGAYRVGGLIGMYAGLTSSLSLSNNSIQNYINEVYSPLNVENAAAIEDVCGIEGGSKARILLQSKMTGIDVGGLVGRIITNSSNESQELRLDNDSTVGEVEIVIETSKSYNIGGLVGYLQMTSATHSFTNKDVQGCVTTNADIISKSNAEHFGGLVGLLKCAGDVGTYTVKGTHMYPFTINTIENQNYVDGKSNFEASISDSDLYLTAQANYINLDSFSVSSSSNVDLYDGVDDKNPIRGDSSGWAKEYTGFRKIQRCIPIGENGNSNFGYSIEVYDSVATVYDAEYITKVATVLNLNYVTEDGGSYTLTPEIPEEAITVEGQIIERTYNGGVHGEPAGYKIGSKEFGLNELDKVAQHIVYTIYEKEFGDPFLYTSSGVAQSLKMESGDFVADYDDLFEYYKNLQEANPGTLGQKYDNDGSKGWRTITLFDTFSDMNTSVEEDKADGSKDHDAYIHVDLSDYSKQLEITDLIKFTWSDDSTRLIKTGTGGEDEYKATTAVDICYYIIDGKLYHFNLMYVNDTINSVSSLSSYPNVVDQPTSGSVFEVCGINPKMPTNTIDDRSWWDKFGGYVIAVITVIIFVALAIITYGGSVWVTAPAWMTKIASVVWFVTGSLSKVGIIIWSAVGVVGIASSCIIQAVQNNTFAATLSSNLYYSIYDQHIGLMTSTVRTPISYSGATQVGQQQNMKYIVSDNNTPTNPDDDETLVYSYYSRLRPDDIYTNYYVYVNPSRVGSYYDPTDLSGESVMSAVELNSDKWEVEGIDEYKFKLKSVGYADDFVAIGEEFTAYKKYIYADGSYYYYTLAGEQKYEITTKLSDIESLGIGNNCKKRNGDSWYVYGIYNGGISYSFKSDIGTNNVTYDDFASEYKLNGVKIDETKAIYKDQSAKFKYYGASSPSGTEGYDWVQGAYYSMNGTDNSHPQIAKFTYFGTVAPSGYTIGKDCYKYHYEDGDVDQYFIMQAIFDNAKTPTTFNEDMSGKDVYIQVYPYTFNSSEVMVELKDSDYYERSTSGISHSVTYFLYDGGYKRGYDIDVKCTDIDKLSAWGTECTYKKDDPATNGCNCYNCQIRKLQADANYTIEEKQVNELYENSVYEDITSRITNANASQKIYVYNADGTKSSFKISELDSIIAGNYYTVDVSKTISSVDKEQFKAKYTYVKHNGKYYARNDNYIIDSEGRINGLTLVGGTSNRKYHLANKYLLNAAAQLYSTFAYRDASGYIHFNYVNKFENAYFKIEIEEIKDNDGNIIQAGSKQYFNLVPVDANTIHPNSYITHFVESCNAILGGGYTLENTGISGIVVKSGTIVIE